MKETDDEETGGDEGREELSGSEPYVTFNEDAASERQTDKDLREMEGKESMSLHQMKEQLLASVCIYVTDILSPCSRLQFDLELFKKMLNFFY